MNPIQQKIDNTARLVSQSQRELFMYEIEDIKKMAEKNLLEALKVEIKKLDRYDFDMFGEEMLLEKEGDYLYRQDVLDLLKTNQE